VVVDIVVVVDEVDREVVVFIIDDTDDATLVAFNFILD
jgi:hypothetical protein